LSLQLDEIGISARHGAHQVAQKLKITTFPARSLVEIVLPSSVVIVRSGTCRGFFTKRTLGLPVAALPSVDDWSCSLTRRV
jgi:hypothetical protein